MWREVVAARDAGLARTVGVSNFSPSQIDELDEAPVLNQIPWSPFDYDPALVAELHTRDVVLEGYSPFKRSDLRNTVLAEIAATHGVTAAQVILRWHIDHGFVAIPKSASPERIASNVDIFGFALSPDEMARVDALGR
jgi:diketogulonate reductase-like aldo/keto reductase